MKWMNVLTGLLCLMMIGLGKASASEQTISDERLKAIVKEVIRENPKLIMDSLNQYNQEQRKKQQERQLEASFKNRVVDTVSENNPQMGPSDAPVTIIEYTDFQCPYCARGAQTLKRVREMYPDKVRVVFKNLPLKMHAQALPAAKAALAAHRQGKFLEYCDLLFKHYNALTQDLYADLATQLGLDTNRFREDYGSENIAAQIDTDLGQARKLGITGAPRFLVNGVDIKGAYPPEYFAKVIDRLLEERTAGGS
jgi:protein-disulfide isomerase